VLWNLGVVVGPLLSLSFLAPALLLGLYRLDRARHAELRSILLDRRRSAGGDHDAS
jgi:hypothetical protein